MYVYHKDFPCDRWNVFRLVNGREVFDRWFKDLKAAQTFCDLMNKSEALKAEALAARS